MAKGGKQPGAGRPKGAISKSTRSALEAKAILVAKIHEEIEPITEALIAKAQEGDIQAIKEVFDRAFGKAVNPVEMSGKDGKDLFNPESKERAIGAIRSFVVGDLGDRQ